MNPFPSAPAPVYTKGAAATSEPDDGPEVAAEVDEATADTPEVVEAPEVEAPKEVEETEETGDQYADVEIPADFDPDTADKRTRVYKAWLAQQEGS